MRNKNVLERSFLVLILVLFRSSQQFDDVRAYVDQQAAHCDDLAMNYVISQAAGGKPHVWLRVRFACARLPDPAWLVVVLRFCI